MTAMKILSCLVMLFLVAGCYYRHNVGYSHQTSRQGGSDPSIAPGEWSNFSYTNNNGCAELICERVVLAFEDLTKNQRDIFHLNDKTESVKMAGSGTASTTTTCSSNDISVQFYSRFADGTNTLDFAGQKIQFSNAGHLLSVGSQSVGLDGPQKTVHISAGKIVSVE